MLCEGARGFQLEIRDQLYALIQEHSGVLERQANHNVWKFPDGRIFVMAKSTGDRRSDQNNLSQLRRMLGAKRESNKNPERREKPGVGRPVYQADPTQGREAAGFRDKLKVAIAAHVERTQEVRDERMDGVANCSHTELGEYGGFTYWDCYCRKRLCGRCFQTHFALLHAGRLEREGWDAGVDL